MNKIDTIRKRDRLSYEGIAKNAGLSATYIHLLAKGKRTNPSLVVMQKIAGALGETIGTVFRTN